MLSNSERNEIWRAIEILVELGEKELAFELRVIYDTYYRPEWKGHHFPGRQTR